MLLSPHEAGLWKMDYLGFNSYRWHYFCPHIFESSLIFAIFLFVSATWSQDIIMMLYHIITKRMFNSILLVIIIVIWWISQKWPIRHLHLQLQSKTISNSTKRQRKMFPFLLLRLTKKSLRSLKDMNQKLINLKDKTKLLNSK